MRLTSKSLILLAMFLAVGALATAGILLLINPASQTLTSGPVIVSKTITTGTATIGGPFTLISTDGQSVSDQSYRGKWLLIFFGYTFCPDACPTALNNISVALEKLGPDARKLQSLFVTIDPERDTRKVMADYLKSFDSRIVGLTGSKEQIGKVVKEYRIYVASAKSETGGDDYLVSHSSYVYLIDPQGQFVNVIQGSAAGEEIADWLRKQMAPTKR